MSPHLPIDGQVCAAMETELAKSEAAGRRVTVTNVEKRLGVTHSTFCRNYPELITCFRKRLADRHSSATPPKNSARAEGENARLRRENSDLRKLVRIFAEATRRLTVDRASLEDELQALSGVTRLTEAASATRTSDRTGGLARRRRSHLVVRPGAFADPGAPTTRHQPGDEAPSEALEPLRNPVDPLPRARHNPGEPQRGEFVWTCSRVPGAAPS
ncbi:hypothetical protein [Kitasatospora sp. NPDC054795]